MCRRHALPGHHCCAVAQAGRHEPQRQRVPVQQGQRGRLSRRRHRRAHRRRQFVGDRQRQRRDHRGRPCLARRGVGAARRDEERHRQAGAHRHQHALPLRSRARQSGLRQRTCDIIGHEFTRRDAARRQPAADAALQELRGRPAAADRRSAEAGRGGSRRGAQGHAADAARGRREQPRVAGGAEADAAERDAAHADDALSRQPRDPDPLSGPRPHRPATSSSTCRRRRW